MSHHFLSIARRFAVPDLSDWLCPFFPRDTR